MEKCANMPFFLRNLAMQRIIACFFAARFRIIKAEGGAFMQHEIKSTIKKLRIEKGLTQDELAEKLNVTRQAVSNWENGKTQPDIETLTKLAEIFDVSAEKIIYGKVKKARWHFNVSFYPDKAIEIGVILAMIISYVEWRSVGWAILHGLLNWGYVIYYLIKY